MPREQLFLVDLLAMYLLSVVRLCSGSSSSPVIQLWIRLHSAVSGMSGLGDDGLGLKLISVVTNQVLHCGRGHCGRGHCKWGNESPYGIVWGNMSPYGFVWALNEIIHRNHSWHDVSTQWKLALIVSAKVILSMENFYISYMINQIAYFTQFGSSSGIQNMVFWELAPIIGVTLYIIYNYI